MDFDQINQIIDKFNQSSIRDLEINDDNFHLHLSKNEKVSDNHQVENLSPKVTTTETQPQSSGATQIKSPMVGTVYLQPEPGKEEYVKVGQKVKAGDVVCIVEAMKMMTEIKSDVSGEITKVLVTNEEMVEFDQPLFEVKEG